MIRAFFSRAIARGDGGGEGEGKAGEKERSRGRGREKARSGKEREAIHPLCFVAFLASRLSRVLLLERPEGSSSGRKKGNQERKSRGLSRSRGRKGQGEGRASKKKKKKQTSLSQLVFFFPYEVPARHPLPSPLFFFSPRARALRHA